MSDELLRQEFKTFSRYLIDREPPAVLEARYLQAHERGIVASSFLSKKDERLVLAARGGGLYTRLADIHARFFLAKGCLRQKLVLVLALLETHPDSRSRADQLAATTGAGFFVKLIGWGLASVALLVVSLVFIPVGRSR